MISVPLWVVVVLIFTLGEICGFIEGRLLRKKPDGEFVVDLSDPEKDVFRIEMRDLNNINQKKYVVLKVRNNN